GPAAATRPFGMTLLTFSERPRGVCRPARLLPKTGAVRNVVDVPSATLLRGQRPIGHVRPVAAEGRPSGADRGGVVPTGEANIAVPRGGERPVSAPVDDAALPPGLSARDFEAALRAFAAAVGGAAVLRAGEAA